MKAFFTLHVEIKHRSKYYIGVFFFIFWHGFGCTSQTNCTQNTDCSAAQICTHGRCQKRKGCKRSTDCLFGQTCKNERCIEERCGTHTECTPTFFCNSGFCQKRSVQGESCNAKTRPCLQGHLCITLEQNSNKSICFRDCSNDPGSCTRTTPTSECVPFADSIEGHTLSVCLNVVQKGEHCSYSGQKQSICRPNTSPPLYCSPTTERCTETRLLSEGASCSSTHSVTAQCNERKGFFCDLKTKKCKKTHLLAKPGEYCSTNPQKAGLSTLPTLCKAGALCTPFNRKKTLERCAIHCDIRDPKGCSQHPGTQCISLFTQHTGLCLLRCAKNEDCEYKEDRCQQVAKTTVCIPHLPFGKQTFGNPCSTLQKDLLCAKGLFCLQKPRLHKGLCSQLCKRDTDCPSVQSGSQQSIQTKCIALSTHGPKACVIPCTKQEECPTSLACLSYQIQMCL